MHTREYDVATGARPGVVDVTDLCAAFVTQVGATDGLLNVWVPHATAALAVIETGSGTEADLLAVLDSLLPPERAWHHQHGHVGHGRDHVVPAVLAPSLTVPVLGGRLALGTWQSVCLVDTNVDNPARRLRLSLLEG
jgi:secondary thiamine-phosphate synthase enzyme